MKTSLIRNNLFYPENNSLLNIKCISYMLIIQDDFGNDIFIYPITQKEDKYVALHIRIYMTYRLKKEDESDNDI